MKKILLTIIIMILMTSTVVGARHSSISFRDMPELITYIGRPDVIGLENAILRVRNESGVQHLTDVLNMIQDKTRLQELEGLTIDELIDDDDGIVAIARGKKEMKFLGFFKAKRTVLYEISEDGSLNRKGRIFDFLFKTI